MKTLVKIRTEIKKAILILSLVLSSACHNVDKIEETETDTSSVTVQCEQEIENDYCDDENNTIHLFEFDDDCKVEEYTEHCKHGCVDEGESGSVRCLDACELTPCETPENRCESSTFVTEYNQGTCVFAYNDDGYRCIENVATRRYCNEGGHCVKGTKERPAHCYGEYLDEI